MNIEQVTRDIATLPTEAQQIIVDLINVLKHRYQTEQQQSGIKPLNLEDQPFIGMWSDRSEMQDSSQWVRNIRQQHWHRNQPI